MSDRTRLRALPANVTAAGVDALCDELAANKLAAESELARALVLWPAEAWPAVRAARLTRDAWGQPDLREMALAVSTWLRAGGARLRTPCLRWVRIALEDAGEWSQWWDDGSYARWLAGLAVQREWADSPAARRHYADLWADRLADLSDRVRQADRHARAMCRALAGGAWLTPLDLATELLRVRRLTGIGIDTLRPAMARKVG